MASRRTRSLLLAFVATILLLVWNMCGQFSGQVLASLVCLSVAGGSGVQAIRLAWASPTAERATRRL